jgi:hypothetical protein
MQSSFRTKELDLRKHFLTRPLVGSLSYGPMTRSPSQGWLCRLASSASFPLRMQPKLRGVRLFPRWDCPPTERASLRWSHWSAKSDRHLMPPCFSSHTRDEDRRESALTRAESPIGISCRPSQSGSSLSGCGPRKLRCARESESSRQRSRCQTRCTTFCFPSS